jgi:hypothetical protein
VRRLLICIVKVKVSASLLDDEDALPQTQHGVKFVKCQLAKTAPPPLDASGGGAAFNFINKLDSTVVIFSRRFVFQASTDFPARKRRVMSATRLP